MTKNNNHASGPSSTDKNGKTAILNSLIELNRKLNRELQHTEKKVDHHKNKKTAPPTDIKNEVLKLMESAEKLLTTKRQITHQYMRALADNVNSQKRAEAELLTTKKYQSLALATKLIPILDTFERALLVTNNDPQVKNFLIGFRMIYKLLVEALRKEGITVMSTEVGDEFDHNIHHAIDVETHEELPENHITKIVSKGYMLSDRVVRHCEVVVVKNPPTADTTKTEQITKKTNKIQKN